MKVLGSVFIVLLALGSCFSQSSKAGSLSSADMNAIRELNDAYAKGWLNNDPEEVMKLFAPDAVLIPQGSPAIKGSDAIRKFYWPEDPPKSRIAQFSITTDEIGGSGDFAYARGTYSFTVQFLMKGVMTPKPNEGNYLVLFKRQPDGRWLITHRMWASLN